LYKKGDKKKLPATKVIPTRIFEPSPFLEIDNFVRKIISDLPGTTGYLKNAMYFSDTNRIIYYVSKNRFCQNIGREHKSNNIMFVAEIDTGLCYQKCFDIDCKDFRSLALQIPFQLLPESIRIPPNPKNDVGKEYFIYPPVQPQQHEDIVNVH